MLVTVGGTTEVVVDGPLEDVVVGGGVVVQMPTEVVVVVGPFLGGY